MQHPMRFFWGLSKWDLFWSDPSLFGNLILLQRWTYSGSNRGGTEGSGRTITFSYRLDYSKTSAPTRKHHGSCRQNRPVHSGWQHQNHCKRNAISTETITKVEFFIGKTLVGKQTFGAPYRLMAAGQTLPLGSSSLDAQGNGDW